jgi:hypothetical protein
LADAAAVVLVGTERMKSLIWWSLMWRPVKRGSLVCAKNPILDQPPETAKHHSVSYGMTPPMVTPDGAKPAITPPAAFSS